MAKPSQPQQPWVELGTSDTHGYQIKNKSDPERIVANADARVIHYLKQWH